MGSINHVSCNSGKYQQWPTALSLVLLDILAAEVDSR